MGSIFGKKKATQKKNGYDQKKNVYESEIRRPYGRSNMRNSGFTQSMSNVSMEPFNNPHDRQYGEPEEEDDLRTRHQSLEDLRGAATPTLPPRINIPLSMPSSRPMSDHRNKDQNAPANKGTNNERDRNGKKEREEEREEFTERAKTEKTNSSKYQQPTESYGSLEFEQPTESYGSLEFRIVDVWPTGPKVRADKYYDAHSTIDFSCKRGDILLLLNERAKNGRYLVRNLSSGKEGHVPTTSVSKITDDDVESQTCLFRWMKRVEAEEKLLEPGLELGTYLLRPSEDGDYALSLRCNDRSGRLMVMHYKIRVVANGECYVDAKINSNNFDNFVELINHYKEGSGLRCRLRNPLPQDVPLADLAVKYADLELGEMIGSGNFGSVYAGKLYKSKKVAVKSLRAGGSMTVVEFRKEAETMHKLRHPRLVSLLAICEGGGNIHIITEIMSKGALQDLLRNSDDHVIRFAGIMEMAIQVVEGMCFLESKSFVHRDLRAANVLVGEGNVTKIADFGLTRLLDSYYQQEDIYQDKKGSVFPYKWTAPEAINKLQFTVKSDVWSFGILLYEMVTYGNEPYPAMSNAEALAWVEAGNRLKKPTDYHCPLALYNIMKQCWLKNPSERPHFEYIQISLLEIRRKA